jgi:hypothetical protein
MRASKTLEKENGLHCFSFPRFFLCLRGPPCNRIQTKNMGWWVVLLWVPLSVFGHVLATRPSLLDYDCVVNALSDSPERTEQTLLSSLLQSHMDDPTQPTFLCKVFWATGGPAVLEGAPCTVAWWSRFASTCSVLTSASLVASLWDHKEWLGTLLAAEATFGYDPRSPNNTLLQFQTHLAMFGSMFPATDMKWRGTPLYAPPNLDVDCQIDPECILQPLGRIAGDTLVALLYTNGIVAQALLHSLGYSDTPCLHEWHSKLAAVRAAPGNFMGLYTS